MSKLLRIMTLVLVSLLPGAASAQVSVTGLSGEIAQNATVTITGSGFGVKSPAAPIKYDSFQQGTPGQTLSEGTPSWNLWANVWSGSDTEAYYPKYSNAASRFNGDIAARQWFGDSPDGYVSNCTIGLTNLQIGKLYVSGWVFNNRSPDGASGARNVKVFFNSVGEWGAPTTRYDCYPINSSGHLTTDGCSETYISNSWGVRVPSPGAWHRLEIYHDRGGSGRNEVMRVHEDNELKGQFENAYTGCEQDRVYLMSYHDENEGNGAEMEWFWGEIYVDNTLARVEIGDAATIAACTHKEIQIPQAWNSSSITVAVNQGTFNANDTAYLYVYDANGNVNNQGYPLVVGGEVIDPGAPGVPGQPTRQQ